MIKVKWRKTPHIYQRHPTCGDFSPYVGEMIRSVGFLNPKDLLVEPLLQYVTELGTALDNIEAVYIRTEEGDSDEPTQKKLPFIRSIYCGMI